MGADNFYEAKGGGGSNCTLNFEAGLCIVFSSAAQQNTRKKKKAVWSRCFASSFKLEEMIPRSAVLEQVVECPQSNTCTSTGSLLCL